MEYQLETLGPEKFQVFCQSLLAREFPKLQCFPIAQRDGGRDAIAYYAEKEHDAYIVFQVKYVRKPFAEKDPHKWLLATMKEEGSKA